MIPRLQLQRCDDCARVQYPPRPTCGGCGSTSSKDQPAAGTGRLYSHTVVHRPPAAGVEVPYVIAVVRLVEGPSLLTRLVDCPLDLLRCDLPVELRWSTATDGAPLPVFTPA